MDCASITPVELDQLRRQDQIIDLVDVRTPGEYHRIHAEGARLVPLDQLDVQRILDGRPTNNGEPIYIICQSGRRSLSACRRLQQAGIANVVNVSGGTSAWVRAGLPVARGDSVSPGGGGGRRGGFGWIRAIGLPLALVCLILGWLVNPLFVVAAAAVWIGMIIVGGGACPLGTCAMPTPDREHIGQLPPTKPS